jgi:L-rhamnose mutarotase
VSVARYCFCLQVKPERAAEYAARHAAVWPEMLAALRETGWRNYSLFLRDDGLLVGYVEADDFTAARAAMAEYFTGLDGRGPDEGFVLLTEVFHLADREES